MEQEELEILKKSMNFFVSLTLKNASLQQVEEANTLKEIKKLADNKINSFKGKESTLEKIKEMVQYIDENTKYLLLSFLDQDRPELVESSRIALNIFDVKDIIIYSDKDLQRILRDIDVLKLAKILKNVKEETQAKFYKNISKRMTFLLKEEIDNLVSVTREEEEVILKEIRNLLKFLEEKGEIVNTKDEYI